MFGFKLNDTLSSSSRANEEDVLTMKGALQRLGEYETPAYGMTPYPDGLMFEGMKRVQKKNGLQVDGIARPGGPTETTIRTGLAQNFLGQGPKQDTKARQPDLPAPLRLGGGVGQNQANRPQDVIGMKNALTWTGHYPLDKAHKADPTPDDDLIWGLSGFQRDFGLNRDAFSHPGGETEAKINQLITPLIQASAATPNPQIPTQSTAWQTMEEPAEKPIQGGAGSDTLLENATGDSGGQLAQATPPSGPPSTPQGSTKVPPALVGVDLPFIHAQEGGKLDGYVPWDNAKNQPLGTSGVTIGNGVDLGKMNAYDLNKLVKNHGLDPALAKKLTPYLGLTTWAADAYVKQHPIHLSQAEADQLSDAKYAQIAGDLARRYDAAMKKAGRTDTFAMLPKKMKTVALSVALQMGDDLPNKSKRFWKTLIARDVPAMEHELRNFGPKHEHMSRRNREADYLTKP